MIGQLKAPSFPDMEDGAFLFDSYQIKKLRSDAKLAVRNILLTQSARALAFRERNAFFIEIENSYQIKLSMQFIVIGIILF